MKNLVALAGNVAAVLGILGCLVAASARILGHYTLGGYELRTLFIAGTALMVMGCLAKLHLIASASTPR